MILAYFLWGNVLLTGEVQKKKKKKKNAKKQIVEKKILRASSRARPTSEEAGRAEFNMATPTYATVTYSVR